MAVLLKMSNVHKRYGGVRALRGASLEAKAGEVHGLLGSNGSGKSTLNKILTGVVAPDYGNIEVGGSAVRIKSPHDAAEANIAAVYQHLTLIPELTVEQNIVLGRESATGGFLKPKTTRRIANEVLARLETALGKGVKPTTPVRLLNPGQQQLIELAKVLVQKPQILILDEATASIHRNQVKAVFDIVSELRNEGVCVLFVSHRLDEVFEICDRATVLRSGETVATIDTATTSEEELVDLMTEDGGATNKEDLAKDLDLGEETELAIGASTSDQSTVLELEELSSPGFTDINLQVKAGEIVGLGGLQGQGQSELLSGLFGLTPITSGRVLVKGKATPINNPRRAARANIALVPGDRGTQGMLAVRPIQENLSIVSLPKRSIMRVFIRSFKERQAAQTVINALRIKLGSLSDPISSLSGGNQQKVVIAKWLLNEPGIILLDDPTKGVDVGAKAEIYELIRQLAKQGAAVVFNSSEDRELVELADRVVVLFEGEITQELTGDDLNEDMLVEAALQPPQRLLPDKGQEESVANSSRGDNE